MDQYRRVAPLLFVLLLASCNRDRADPRREGITTSPSTTSSITPPTTGSPPVSEPTAAPPPSPAERFIGLEYVRVAPGEEFPAGVQHIGGGTVGNVETSPHGFEQVKEGGRLMVWLERMLGPPPPRGERPRVRVVDAFDFGVLQSRQETQQGQCWHDDGRRPPQTPPLEDVLVVVSYGPRSPDYSTNIAQAVRLNASIERIETIPSNGLVCERYTSGD